MSSADYARSADFQVIFDGTDITNDIHNYLLSITYTDNEEDESDDLQIKLADKNDLWLKHWLNDAILTAVELKSSSRKSDDSAVSQTSTNQYMTSASQGLNVRSGPGTNYSKLGVLAYGTIINVISTDNGWAKINYSGKEAYVYTQYIKLVQTTGSGKTNSWKVGDSVVANGKPQYSSYGKGTPGRAVTNYSGKITNLNIGAPYPICVGYLGWFAESEVSRSDGKVVAPSQNVTAASKGLRIQAVMMRKNWNSDGKDDILECGQFELDSVQAQGPPSTITIKGTALSYSSSVRQTEKSKSWENYTLKGIVEEIAQKNGLGCLFSAKNNPSYKRVEQYKTTDIAFLQKLCKDSGNSLKVSNNIIIIFDISATNNAITRIDRSSKYSKYTLKTNKDKTYTSCRVSYTTADGRCISGTAYIEDYKEDKEDNQQLEVYQKVSSKSEAEQLAKKHLNLHNKYELTASFTFPGDTSLVAGRIISLTGWGAWDGRYAIKQAKHSISKSGYTTQIDLRKLYGYEEIKSSEANTSTGDKSIDEVAKEVIRGKWGNNPERKQRLTAAGYDYAAVQKRVNELMR